MTLSNGFFCFLPQCFFQVCFPDTNKNRDQVELYRQKHAQPGDKYPCYFDPNRVTNGAYLRRNIHWTFAFHVLAWPGFSLLGSIIMCIYITYMKRRKPRNGAAPSKFNHKRKAECLMKSESAASTEHFANSVTSNLSTELA